MGILALTPYVPRRESPHGQGVLTYGEANLLLLEGVSPQAAPDPMRQGATPSRPSRRQVVVMSTRPDDWNSGFQEQFIPYAKSLVRRLQPAGRQLGIRAQNTMGVRPNIDRPETTAYGSLFSLSSQNYGL